MTAEELREAETRYQRAFWRAEGERAARNALVRNRGEAIARRYAEEGAKVVVNDIVESSAQRVAGEIRAQGGAAEARVGDVSRDAEVAGLVQSAQSEHPGRFGLVLAGCPPRGRARGRQISLILDCRSATCSCHGNTVPISRTLSLNQREHI